eukprot:gene8141-5675_t
MVMKIYAREKVVDKRLMITYRSIYGGGKHNNNKKNSAQEAPETLMRRQATAPLPKSLPYLFEFQTGGGLSEGPPGMSAQQTRPASCNN